MLDLVRIKLLAKKRLSVLRGRMAATGNGSGPSPAEKYRIFIQDVPADARVITEVYNTGTALAPSPEHVRIPFIFATLAVAYPEEFSGSPVANAINGEFDQLIAGWAEAVDKAATTVRANYADFTDFKPSIQIDGHNHVPPSLSGRDLQLRGWHISDGQLAHITTASQDNFLQTYAADFAGQVDCAANALSQVFTSTFDHGPDTSGDISRPPSPAAKRRKIDENAAAVAQGNASAAGASGADIFPEDDVLIQKDPAELAQAAMGAVLFSDPTFHSLGSDTYDKPAMGAAQQGEIHPLAIPSSAGNLASNLHVINSTSHDKKLPKEQKTWQPSLAGDRKPGYAPTDPASINAKAASLVGRVSTGSVANDSLLQAHPHGRVSDAKFSKGGVAVKKERQKLVSKSVEEELRVQLEQGKKEQRKRDRAAAREKNAANDGKARTPRAKEAALGKALAKIDDLSSRGAISKSRTSAAQRALDTLYVPPTDWGVSDSDSSAIDEPGPKRPRYSRNSPQQKGSGISLALSPDVNNRISNKLGSSREGYRPLDMPPSFSTASAVVVQKAASSSFPDQARARAAASKIRERAGHHVQEEFEAEDQRAAILQSHVADASELEYAEEVLRHSPLQAIRRLLSVDSITLLGGPEDSKVHGFDFLTREENWSNVTSLLRQDFGPHFALVAAVNEIRTYAEPTSGTSFKVLAVTIAPFAPSELPNVVKKCSNQPKDFLLTLDTDRKNPDLRTEFIKDILSRFLPVSWSASDHPNLTAVTPTDEQGLSQYSFTLGVGNQELRDSFAESWVNNSNADADELRINKKLWSGQPDAVTFGTSDFFEHLRAATTPLLPKASNSTDAPLISTPIQSHHVRGSKATRFYVPNTFAAAHALLQRMEGLPLLEANAAVPLRSADGADESISKAIGNRSGPRTLGELTTQGTTPAFVTWESPTATDALQAVLESNEQIEKMKSVRTSSSTVQPGKIIAQIQVANSMNVKKVSLCDSSPEEVMHWASGFKWSPDHLCWVIGHAALHGTSVSCPKGTMQQRYALREIKLAGRRSVSNFSQSDNVQDLIVEADAWFLQPVSALFVCDSSGIPLAWKQKYQESSGRLLEDHLEADGIQASRLMVFAGRLIPSTPSPGSPHEDGKSPHGAPGYWEIRDLVDVKARLAGKSGCPRVALSNIFHSFTLYTADWLPDKHAAILARFLGAEGPQAVAVTPRSDPVKKVDSSSPLTPPGGEAHPTCVLCNAPLLPKQKLITCGCSAKHLVHHKCYQNMAASGLLAEAFSVDLAPPAPVHPPLPENPMVLQLHDAPPTAATQETLGEINMQAILGGDSELGPFQVFTIPPPAVVAKLDSDGNREFITIPTLTPPRDGMMDSWSYDSGVKVMGFGSDNDPRRSGTEQDNLSPTTILRSATTGEPLPVDGNIILQLLISEEGAVLVRKMISEKLHQILADAEGSSVYEALKGAIGDRLSLIAANSWPPRAPVDVLGNGVDHTSEPLYEIGANSYSETHPSTDLFRWHHTDALTRYAGLADPLGLLGDKLTQELIHTARRMVLLRLPKNFGSTTAKGGIFCAEGGIISRAREPITTALESAVNNTSPPGPPSETATQAPLSPFLASSLDPYWNKPVMHMVPLSNDADFVLFESTESKAMGGIGFKSTCKCCLPVAPSPEEHWDPYCLPCDTVDHTLPPVVVTTAADFGAEEKGHVDTFDEHTSSSRDPIFAGRHGMPEDFITIVVGLARRTQSDDHLLGSPRIHIRPAQKKEERWGTKGAKKGALLSHGSVRRTEETGPGWHSDLSGFRVTYNVHDHTDCVTLRSEIENTKTDASEDSSDKAVYLITIAVSKTACINLIHGATRLLRADTLPSLIGEFSTTPLKPPAMISDINRHLVGPKGQIGTASAIHMGIPQPSALPTSVDELLAHPRVHPDEPQFPSEVPVHPRTRPTFLPETSQDAQMRTDYDLTKFQSIISEADQLQVPSGLHLRLLFHLRGLTTDGAALHGDPPLPPVEGREDEEFMHLSLPSKPFLEVSTACKKAALAAPAPPSRRFRGDQDSGKYAPPPTARGQKAAHRSFGADIDFGGSDEEEDLLSDGDGFVQAGNSFASGATFDRCNPSQAQQKSRDLAFEAAGRLPSSATQTAVLPRHALTLPEKKHDKIQATLAAKRKEKLLRKKEASQSTPSRPGQAEGLNLLSPGTAQESLLINRMRHRERLHGSAKPSEINILSPLFAGPYGASRTSMGISLAPPSDDDSPGMRSDNPSSPAPEKDKSKWESLGPVGAAASARAPDAPVALRTPLPLLEPIPSERNDLFAPPKILGLAPPDNQGTSTSTRKSFPPAQALSLQLSPLRNAKTDRAQDELSMDVDEECADANVDNPFFCEGNDHKAEPPSPQARLSENGSVVATDISPNQPGRAAANAAHCDDHQDIGAMSCDSFSDSDESDISSINPADVEQREQEMQPLTEGSHQMPPPVNPGAEIPRADCSYEGAFSRQDMKDDHDFLRTAADKKHMSDATEIPYLNYFFGCAQGENPLCLQSAQNTMSYLARAKLQTRNQVILEVDGRLMTILRSGSYTRIPALLSLTQVGTALVKKQQIPEIFDPDHPDAQKDLPADILFLQSNEFRQQLISVHTIVCTAAKGIFDAAVSPALHDGFNLGATPALGGTAARSKEFEMEEEMVEKMAKIPFHESMWCLWVQGFPLEDIATMKANFAVKERGIGTILMHGNGLASDMKKLRSLFHPEERKKFLDHKNLKLIPETSRWARTKNPSTGTIRYFTTADQRALATRIIGAIDNLQHCIRLVNKDFRREIPCISGGASLGKDQHLVDKQVALALCEIQKISETARLDTEAIFRFIIAIVDSDAICFHSISNPKAIINPGEPALFFIQFAHAVVLADGFHFYNMKAATFKDRMGTKHTLGDHWFDDVICTLTVKLNLFMAWAEKSGVFEGFGFSKMRRSTMTNQPNMGLGLGKVWDIYLKEKERGDVQNSFVGMLVDAMSMIFKAGMDGMTGTIQGRSSPGLIGHEWQQIDGEFDPRRPSPGVASSPQSALKHFAQHLRYMALPDTVEGWSGQMSDFYKQVLYDLPDYLKANGAPFRQGLQGTYEQAEVALVRGKSQFTMPSGDPLVFSKASAAIQKALKTTFLDVPISAFSQDEIRQIKAKFGATGAPPTPPWTDSKTSTLQVSSDHFLVKNGRWGDGGLPDMVEVQKVINDWEAWAKLAIRKRTCPFCLHTLDGARGHKTDLDPLDYPVGKTPEQLSSDQAVRTYGVCPAFQAACSRLITPSFGHTPPPATDTKFTGALLCPQVSENGDLVKESAPHKQATWVSAITKAVPLAKITHPTVEKMLRGSGSHWDAVFRKV